MANIANALRRDLESLTNQSMAVRAEQHHVNRDLHCAECGHLICSCEAQTDHPRNKADALTEIIYEGNAITT